MRDRQPQCGAEAPRHGLGFGAWGGPLARRALGPLPLRLHGSLLLGEIFDLAHAQTLLQHAERHGFGIVEGQQRARMPGRETSPGHERRHRLGQVEQAQRIGHMAAALADHGGQFGLRVTELPSQPFIAARLFDGVEIRALNVFDDGEGEGFPVVGLDHHDRHFGEFRRLGGAPAALARDDLVGARHIGNGPHDDGLDDPLGADRFGEGGQIAGIELAARVARVGT